MTDHKNFLVQEGAKLDLSKHKTDFTGDYKDKLEAQEDLKNDIARLTELQETLYAQDVNGLLIIFQAMDAAGKDSVIKHVMSGLNPQGVEVTSFKQPSAEERDHDFLWRVMKKAPERGKIGIFNRSHYEEVLVVRVHENILQSQQLPKSEKNSRNIWKNRFTDIKNYESYLTRNGIHILKFFLHVSRDEQKKRFLERIDRAEKNWKFSAADVKEREHWDDYMKAYEEALSATSTKDAPWYVIPADKKWFTRAIVADIIVKRLESMKLEFPQFEESRRAELIEAKKLLESEKR